MFEKYRKIEATGDMPRFHTAIVHGIKELVPEAPLRTIAEIKKKINNLRTAWNATKRQITQGSGLAAEDITKNKWYEKCDGIFNKGQEQILGACSTG